MQDRNSTSSPFLLSLIEPMSFERKVSKANGNPARRITLPEAWTKYHEYPTEVFVVRGNFLIISTTDDKELAMQAAQVLFEEDIMSGIGEPEMEEVG